MLALLKRLFADPAAVKGFLSRMEVWGTWFFSVGGGIVATLVVALLHLIIWGSPFVLAPVLSGLVVTLASLLITQLHKLTSGQLAIVTPAKLIAVTDEPIDVIRRNAVPIPNSPQGRAINPTANPVTKVDQTGQPLPLY